ncbi:unnamed protein product [Owenia fusiformis]|uniref:Olfactomedin-like domain-containing protein n=1 Tax=Owenia fusiformis TaxID=6347 RepID=A0A8S4NRI9_OWEFU|nr:unnamed protein product [Owenia fusiformis]
MMENLFIIAFIVIGLSTDVHAIDNADGQTTDKKIHPRLAELARIAVELKLDLERVTEKIESKLPGKTVKEWIGVANSMLMYMLSKSLQFASTSPKGSPQATAIWKFRKDILKQFQLDLKNMKKEKSKAGMMKFLSSYKRLCNELKEWIDDNNVSPSKTATEHPCLTQVPCPTQEPCPTQVPCPTQEPCPTREPCPTCPTQELCPTCPTQELCPTREPCPTQEPCPTCPTQEPCPTCPTQEPCPTCPTQEPCPTCPTQEPCPTTPFNSSGLTTFGQTSEVSTFHIYPTSENSTQTTPSCSSSTAMVLSIGNAVDLKSGLGSHGWWFVDPMDSTAWVMKGYTANTLERYTNEMSLSGTPIETITLEFIPGKCELLVWDKGVLQKMRITFDDNEVTTKPTPRTTRDIPTLSCGTSNTMVLSIGNAVDLKSGLGSHGWWFVDPIDSTAWVMKGYMANTLERYTNEMSLSGSPIETITFEFIPGKCELLVWDKGVLQKMRITFNDIEVTTKPTPRTTRDIPTLSCGTSNTMVLSIGNAVDLKSGLGSHGWWFVDPIDSTAWVMKGFTANTLERYANEMSLSGSPIETITLGQSCDGTGHAIYAGYFYCNLANSNRVVKIQISTKENVGEGALTDAGFHNTYHYQWGGYSDIDLALDTGNQLYAIYGSKQNGGNYAIAHLDIDTLVIVRKWQLNVKKIGSGNSFMANGMLYILNSYSSPTYFTHRFDTKTSRLTSLSPSELRYPGPKKGYINALEFIPGKCELLVWDNGVLQKLPITFDDIEVTTKPTPRTTSDLPTLSCGSSTAMVLSIRNAVDLKSGLGTHGWWFVDAIDSTAWVTKGYSKVNTLERYTNEMSLSGNHEIITLGQACDGTGHVIYAGFFYCNLANSNRVVKIQISTKENVGEVALTDAGFHNTYPYSWGGYSDIDLALDTGNQLYAIYGSKQNGGNYAIAHLDIDTLLIIKTWQLNVKKRGSGNSFMANRMLYILNSYSSPTYFTHRFDTRTSRLTSLSPSELRYPGPKKGYINSLEFIPGKCELLVWDNGVVQKLAITFDDIEVTTKPTPKTTRDIPTLSCGTSNTMVLSIGNAVDLKSGLGTHGWWFVDPIDSTAWVMKGFTANTLERYANEMSLSGSPIETITLEQSCDGTGHVIYAGFFYCNLANSNRVVKIQISTKENVGEVALTDAGFRNTYHYQWGGYTDIDLALDTGNQLYAIYGSKQNGGNYAIAHLDIDTLVIVKTWQLNVKKRGSGNSFMANGMLYILNSYSSPTYFTHRFDTTTSSLTSLSSSGLRYPGPKKGYINALEFIPGKCEILVWDNGVLQKMSVSF